MRLAEQLDAVVPRGTRSSAAAGTFDGVHLGHRGMLARVASEAERRALSPVAVTFKKQPREVIAPEKPTRYLSGLDERLSLIREAGAEHLAAVDFDASVRVLACRDFLAVLREHIGLETLVLGPTARMGSDRLSPPEIARVAASLGVVAVNTDPVKLTDGTLVSSSAIRDSLASGDVDAASAMLGRHYALDGVVAHGDRRGRQMGFPTANLSPEPDRVVPGDGIYATFAVLDGRRHMAATSIGTRPTFGPGARTVETYIVDFDRDIYDLPLRVEFVSRLRGEMKFDGVEPLVEQMNRDVEQARSVLAAARR